MSPEKLDFFHVFHSDQIYTMVGLESQTGTIFNIGCWFDKNTGYLYHDEIICKPNFNR